MWPRRLTRAISTHPGPIVLSGDANAGIPFVIDAFSNANDLAWLSISEHDACDEIVLGNELSESVNRALKTEVLRGSLSYPIIIDTLRKDLAIFGPLIIAVSNAERNPEFCQMLAQLNIMGSKVIFDSRIELAVDGALHVSAEELLLTEDEAHGLGLGHLPREVLSKLWLQHHKQATPIMLAVSQLIGKTPPIVPGATSRFLTGSFARNPRGVIEMLIRKGNFRLALELAVTHARDMVVNVVTDAGPEFQDRGEHKKLYRLLSSLSVDERRHEDVLEWYYLAAFGAGKTKEVEGEVELFLSDHDAPDLRARYAYNIERKHHAFRALELKRSSLTLYQCCRYIDDFDERIALAKEGLQLAEMVGRPYERVRNAHGLALAYFARGDLVEALTWYEHALGVFSHFGLQDELRRLHMLNNLIYTKILLGKTADLREHLNLPLDMLILEHPNVGILLATTTAETELILGKTREAERIARSSYSQAQNLGFYLSRATETLQRVLHEQKNYEEAEEITLRSLFLAKDTADEEQMEVLVAISQVETKPEVARTQLEKWSKCSALEANLGAKAALYFLLLRFREDGQLHLGELPEATLAYLKNLAPSGLKVLAGPEEDFRAVFAAVAWESNSELDIRVLGQTTVVCDGKQLAISKRLLDCLVVLASHPEGMTVEALDAKLHPHGQTEDVGRTRATLSRLRNLLSGKVDKTTPRLNCSLGFDVLSCKEALDSGKFGDAAKLYQGPLLEESHAPGVVEAREELEEQVRQASLGSDDTDSVMDVAELLKDDLEVWRHAFAVLPKIDTRRPSVKAKITVLERDYNA